MSNQKHSKAERQDFMMRLAAIEPFIPFGYSVLVSDSTGVSKEIVRNVRAAKTINFQVLEALEKISKLTTV